MFRRSIHDPRTGTNTQQQVINDQRICTNTQQQVIHQMTLHVIAEKRRSKIQHPLGRLCPPYFRTRRVWFFWTSWTSENSKCWLQHQKLRSSSASLSIKKGKKLFFCTIMLHHTLLTRLRNLSRTSCHNPHTVPILHLRIFISLDHLKKVFT